VLIHGRPRPHEIVLWMAMRQVPRVNARCKAGRIRQEVDALVASFGQQLVIGLSYPWADASFSGAK
jgi:hypothetical protein